LSNADIREMAKHCSESPVIVDAAQTGKSDFEESTLALVELKNSGVSRSVLQAKACCARQQAFRFFGSGHGPASPEEPPSASASKTGCSKRKGGLLPETTRVNLKFAADVNSKTAPQGDPVEFALDEEVKLAAL
jgi:hypothetical protein